LNLRIYLDDCAYDKGLTRLLLQSGCDVVTPFDAGIAGQPDAVHFAYATSRNLILLTKNPRDFEELHVLHPQHPGIFAVYQDNDPTKDLSITTIVRAIQNLVDAEVAISGQFISLNAWRYVAKKGGE
jgi:predicted nuclease of predicted toxin-antitoxin system